VFVVYQQGNNTMWSFSEGPVQPLNLATSDNTQPNSNPLQNTACLSTMVPSEFSTGSTLPQWPYKVFGNVIDAPLPTTSDLESAGAGSVLLVGPSEHHYAGLYHFVDSINSKCAGCVMIHWLVVQHVTVRFVFAVV